MTSPEFDLDQTHDFWTMASYYEGWGGQSERWIRGDGDSWFYLLPTGAIHEWVGSFADSPLWPNLTRASTTTQHNLST